MIVYLSALRQEHSRIIHLLGRVRRVEAAPCWLVEGQYRGQPLVLARSGMGRGAAEAAFHFIHRRYPLQALIFLGFAGGLQPELTGGELVLCDTFVRPAGEEGQSGPVSPPSTATADPTLHRLACGWLQEAGLSCRVGRSVTLIRPVITAEQRLALAAACDALTAEMEDYWLATLAAAAGVPFLSVRAISDAVDDRLPDFDRFTGERGNLRWGRLLGHLLLHPAELLALAPLANKMRLAQASLFSAFQALAGRRELTPLDL